MSKAFYLIALIALLAECCSKKLKSPLEGTWRCISVGSVQLPDTTPDAMSENGMIKTFSNRYFTFVGHISNDTLVLDEYGAGTYSLNGNKYEEHIIYHDVKSLIGKSFKALDEIRNDTLIHRYNTNNVDNWKLGKGSITEKFVRLK